MEEATEQRFRFDSPAARAANGDDEDSFDEFGFTSRQISQASTTSASPRCEAFVMTGEKILRLNSKVSPSFAKLKYSELPSHTQVLDSSFYASPFRGAGDGFPLSCSESRLVESAGTTRSSCGPGGDFEPGENSFRGNHYNTQTSANDTDGGSVSSSLTVNALCQTTCLSAMMDRAVGSPTANDSFPSSPSFDPSGTRNRRHPADPRILAAIQNDETSKSEPNSPSKVGFQGNLVYETPESVDERRIHIYTTGEGKSVITFDDEENVEAEEYNVHSLENGDEVVPEEPVGPTKRGLEALDENIGAGIPSKDPDPGAASRLAKRLYMLDGFRKSDVAKLFSKNNDFSNMLAREYSKQFEFSGLRLDAALRLFLARFTLTGESSEREKLMAHFSTRYYECNPEVLGSEDEVHCLACALLLLNTDLHAQMVSRRMSSNDFISNICKAAPSYSFSRELLKQVYDSIKNNPILHASDGNDSDNTDSGCQTSQTQLYDNRFLVIHDSDSQIEYKRGWVMRKCIVEQDGKKCPLGKRGWRMFFATLKGLVLYLHKDDSGFRKRGQFNTFNNCIRVHHAIASRADDYKKKQNVFRLMTANWGEFLFYTSDPKEVDEWILKINYVAAAFSSPPLPAPVSSCRTFHRPLLPSAPTRHSLVEQLKGHEKRVLDLELQLSDHVKNIPPRHAKSRVKDEYLDIQNFLQSEKNRYTHYVAILRSQGNEYYGQNGVNAASALDSATSSSDGLHTYDYQNSQCTIAINSVPSSLCSVTVPSSYHSDPKAAKITADRQSYKEAIYNGRSASYETYF